VQLIKTFKKRKRSSKRMKDFQYLEREKSQRRSWKAASPEVMENWTLSTSQKAQLANLSPKTSSTHTYKRQAPLQIKNLFKTKNRTK
jgi:hypothetical protein